MKLFRFLMIACKDATLLCSKQAELRLSFRERMQLKIHLLLCKPCRYFSKQVSLLLQSYRKFAEQQSATWSEESKEALQKKINDLL